MWRTVAWAGADNDVIAFDVPDDMPDAIADASGAVLIEEMPHVPVPGEKLGPGPVDDPSVYRITARATGVAGNATVTLQTTYRR